MADGSDFKSESRDRSRSPMDRDDDSRDGDKGRDRRGRTDRGRKMDRPRGGGRRGSAELRVFVSNIPYEFKWQDLKDLFRKEVGEVAYVEMFNDENSRPKGCAIIEFDTADLASKAVDIMHRYELKGRKLVVKEGSSRDFDERERRMMKSDIMRPRELPRGLDLPTSQPKFGNTFGLSTVFLESLGISGNLVNKVFVANLDYKVDEKMLQDVFKLSGKVTHVEITKDADGKSRGFGTVEFDHPVEAVQAISMFHNQAYYDRKMSVRMDRVTEKKDTVSKLPPGLKGLGMGLGVNGSALTDVSTVGNAAATGVTAMSNVASVATNMNAMGGQTMNMMGMTGTGMATGMGNMGTGMGNMGVVGAGMNTGMNNMSNGMGGSMMGGMGGGMSATNTMVSSLAGGLGSGVSASSGLMSSSVSRGGIGNNSYGGSSGISRDFGYGSGGNSGSSSSFSGGYRNLIQISNLPMEYTWQSLRDLCREFGDIRFAEIRNKGTGTVRFQSESDARRAVEMLDRQRMDGRILDVILV